MRPPQTVPIYLQYFYLRFFCQRPAKQLDATSEVIMQPDTHKSGTRDLIGLLIDQLGSRSRGHHPVAPRPIAAGTLCSVIYFHPSSPEALHVKRYDRRLLVKDGITGEKWPVNLACDSDFHVNRRVL
jgi:hypothetical protein